MAAQKNVNFIFHVVVTRIYEYRKNIQQSELGEMKMEAGNENGMGLNCHSCNFSTVKSKHKTNYF